MADEDGEDWVTSCGFSSGSNSVCVSSLRSGSFPDSFALTSDNIKVVCFLNGMTRSSSSSSTLLRFTGVRSCVSCPQENGSLQVA